MDVTPTPVVLRPLLTVTIMISVLMIAATLLLAVLTSLISAMMKTLVPKTPVMVNVSSKPSLATMKTLALKIHATVNLVVNTLKSTVTITTLVPMILATL